MMIDHFRRDMFDDDLQHLKRKLQMTCFSTLFGTTLLTTPDNKYDIEIDKNETI